MGTRQDAGGKQRGCRAIECPIGAASHLVERSQRQPTAWQPFIDVEYRKKVREYARQQLKTINPEQERNKTDGDGAEKKAKIVLPDWLMKTGMCKELLRIAALPDHDAVGDDPDESDKTSPIDKNIPLEGNWAMAYSALFEHHLDRKIVTFLTIVAGVVLVIGAANSINAWRFLIPLFEPAEDHHPNAQTDVIFWLLVGSLLLPMVFVWFGKKVVVWGRARVRQLVSDCRLVMQRPAQEATVNGNGPAPVVVQQQPLPALPGPNAQEH